MSQSTRFRIARALAGVLQDMADQAQACFRENPALPTDLQDAGLLLFTLDRGDLLVAQPGLREQRRMRIVIGAYAGAGGDVQAAADALHFGARAALRRPGSGLRTVFRDLALDVREIRETELEPGLREVIVPGELLLSVVELSYFETYPDA